MRRPPLLLILPLLASCALLSSLGGTGDAELRVASYNIRHGRGMDQQVALERTAATIRSLDAEIVGLQEVDERVQRSGRADQAALLGGLLGMEHRFGAFFDYQGGRYGMAILSKHPIVGIEEIALPPGEEPRIALAARIALPTGDTITVVNVHFDWVSSDRARVAQADQLADRLAGIEGPWLVMGDFNDEPRSRTLRAFRSVIEQSTKEAGAELTFPSDAPEREIDHIFAARDGLLRPVESWAVIDSVASDHRPVVATFRYAISVPQVSTGRSRR
ncbi:MAG TPA: endonuclease/exonuclease/phosphatase family protein [Gemmatimonadales bacterium]|nr:endonuclease/exonuclease/phosphatase family protein [Gemmatimonadales bacterium]